MVVITQSESEDPADKIDRSQRRYRESDKGKEAQKKYRLTEAGKESRRRYQDSERGKEAHKRYRIRARKEYEESQKILELLEERKRIGVCIVCGKNDHDTEYHTT